MIVYDKVIGPRDYVEIVTGKYYILNAENQLEEAKAILKLSGFGELSDHSLVKVDKVSGQDKKFILVEFVNATDGEEMDFIYRWCEFPECITEERVIETVGG